MWCWRMCAGTATHCGGFIECVQAQTPKQAPPELQWTRATAEFYDDFHDGLCVPLDTNVLCRALCVWVALLRGVQGHTCLLSSLGNQAACQLGGPVWDQGLLQSVHHGQHRHRN